MLSSWSPNLLLTLNCLQNMALICTQSHFKCRILPASLYGLALLGNPTLTSQHELVKIFQIRSKCSVRIFRKNRGETISFHFNAVLFSSHVPMAVKKRTVFKSRFRFFFSLVIQALYCQKDYILVFKASYVVIRISWAKAIAVRFMALAWSCLLVPFLCVYHMTVLSTFCVCANVKIRLLPWNLYD